MIAARLLTWHREHGRHDLPWQQQVSPYRVWVSEIMLQQTQVQTVMPYFERFMQHFPDVAALAAAPLDEVLHLWAGLGYYSRARNLHRSAQHLMAEWGGSLPQTEQALQSLPGIGRSTAAAILALGSGLRHAILDGNVKRVLARHHAIEGSPVERVVDQRLWQIAEQETPQHDVARYTQAIMDLGATVCMRARPLCIVCPIQEDCQARLQGRVAELPTPKKRAARGERQIVMLIARRQDGSIWLQHRPASGIWGGLWSPPEFADQAEAREFAQARFRVTQLESQPRPAIQHAFTHFDLTILPLVADCAAADMVMEEGTALWYNPARPARIGLPAPVQTLIRQLGGPEAT